MTEEAAEIKATEKTVAQTEDSPVSDSKYEDAEESENLLAKELETKKKGLQESLLCLDDNEDKTDNWRM